MAFNQVPVLSPEALDSSMGGDNASEPPTFIDTGMCKCAIQNTDEPQTAWRCLGNHTDNIYEGTSGKWFQLGDKDQVVNYTELPVNDASAPPDNTTAFLATPGVNDQQKILIPLNGTNNGSLSMYDAACTGTNDTRQSTKYYMTLTEMQENITPWAAAMCMLMNTTPLTIQNATSWYEKGCYDGFYCENNTINALPQYCIPVVPCQEGRLAGQQCNGVPMGFFEPTLCLAGMYCPPGGKKQLTCPAGYYCPPGTVVPKPCSGGASCPEGSTYMQPILPIILLLLWDLLLVCAFVFTRWLRKRGRNVDVHRGGMMDYLHKANPTGYFQPRHRPRAFSEVSLASSNGEEEYEMQGTIRSVKHTETGGFLAAASQWPEGLPHDEEAHGHSELEAFVASLSRCIQGSSFGLSFSFRDLTYQPKTASKPILSNISGRIRAGTMLGVMGGSGAGKSTFVNVLMGKRSHTGGETKVNGLAGEMKHYKKIIGYVPQDDILLAELSVRENILHSARVRLPWNWSDAEIQHHVDILLQCLKLDHVKDNIVGSVMKPGVSGGQRKRVSIGMELAAAPMALFLDEPTSGLDATAASSIMELLKALSRLGITIVTIIHQPRQEIFESLDDLILLGNGRLLYEGATVGVQRYFEGCGFQFPRSQNPADVIMDIINEQGRPYKRVGETSISALIENWSNRTSSQPEAPLIVPPQDEVMALKLSIRQRGTSGLHQLWLCQSRAMLQQYRNAQSFWFEMGVAALAGLIVGLAENSQHGVNFHGYFRDEYMMLSSSIDYNSVAQMSLLVGISIGLVSASPGVKVFGEEKLMFYREAAAGHNRLAYYLGKVLSTFPRILLAAIHFTTLFILVATPTISWVESFGANILYFYCIYGLASVVSMVTRREDGPLLAVMASLIVGTLSGMAPTLSTVDGWHMVWLWRSSPGTWLSEAYFDRSVEPWSDIYDTESASSAVGFNLGAYALDCVVLFTIGTLYRAIAFAAMRSFNISRQR